MGQSGIVSALLAEVSVYADMTGTGPGVTAELKARCRKPVPVEKEVIVSAQVVSQTRRVVMVAAELAMQGEILASAEAKMVVVRS